MWWECVHSEGDGSGLTGPGRLLSLLEMGRGVWEHSRWDSQLSKSIFWLNLTRVTTDLELLFKRCWELSRKFFQHKTKQNQGHAFSRSDILREWGVTQWKQAPSSIHFSWHKEKHVYCNFGVCRLILKYKWYLGELDPLERIIHVSPTVHTALRKARPTVRNVSPAFSHPQCDFMWYYCTLRQWVWVIMTPPPSSKGPFEFLWFDMCWYGHSKRETSWVVLENSQ